MNDLRRVVLAVLLGATAGLFISGYWLIDLLPASSRLLIAVTAACGLAAALAYYAILGKVAALGRGLPARSAMMAGIGAAVLGAFLFFGGTSNWRAPGRYIGFLLPAQQFSLTSTASPGETSIDWINTSLGDVSFDALASTGWARRGDRMNLRDPSSNSLEWRGQTGERIEIVFDSPKAGAELHIRWGNESESIRLGPGKSSYVKTFAVPYLASSSFVLALGALHFWLLSLLALLAVGDRIRTAPSAAGSIGGAEGPGSAIRTDILVLAAMMGVALLLRAFNLGALFPAVDEYYHLIAADQLLRGSPLASVYPRGLWIVTIPVAFALRLLGHEIWAGRAIGVVFNVLALVPLYVVMRKTSRSAAIAVCLLYASSPWIITFARVAREYAYYPLYFYLIVWAMISLVEALPARFVLSQDWRTVLRPRTVFVAVLLLVPPIFALRIDWLSTFRTILIAYLVLGAFLLGRFDWRARANWPVLAAAGIALGGAGWYFFQEQLTKLVLLPRVNPVPLGYFFPNPPQQWYYERVTILMAIAVVIAVVGAVRLRRATIVPLFFASLFAAYLAVFTLFSKTFFHTRHLMSTQLWYVVVAGLGLCWLWEWLRAAIPWKGGAAGPVLAVVLAALTLNSSQILLPTLSRNPDMPISEDYLHDMSGVQAYMESHAHAGDALISTVYGLYATWMGTPEFGRQSRINSSTSLDEIAAMMQGEPSGWLVVDSIRLDVSTLTERSLSSLPQMEYIGTFGDEHVWRWGLPPSN